MKCKKSAKATKNEDGTYLLYSWDGQHSSECRPNSALAAVKKVRDAIKAKVLEDPTIKPSVVYSSEVFRVRDNLSEADKIDFDCLMPTQSVLNASIFGWKRQVIPANPDTVEEIDITGPFFTLESGESMVKHDSFINEDRSRRLLILTSDKVMKAAVQMASKGVMDATFKVLNLSLKA